MHDWSERARVRDLRPAGHAIAVPAFGAVARDEADA